MPRSAAATSAHLTRQQGRGWARAALEILQVDIQPFLSKMPCSLATQEGSCVAFSAT